MMILDSRSQFPTYRNRSSGENARPLGPASSSVTSATSPPRTANTPENGSSLAGSSNTPGSPNGGAGEKSGASGRAPPALGGVVEHAGQPERRVGEEQRAVGTAHHVVRRVQAPALVAVRHNGDVPVRLDPDDAPVAVLADDQPPIGVERQAIGARLVIAPD